MADAIETILTSQETLRGLITRATINLNKLEKRKRTPMHARTRIEAIESNWAKFQENHEALCALATEKKEKFSYFSEDVYSECQEIYLDNKAEMLTLLQEWQPQRSRASDQNENVANNTTIKGETRTRQLPRLNLPKFSGSYTEWVEFRDLFASMVTVNDEIPPVEKLQYLKMSLTGEAKNLLKNISVSNENFARAWDVLVNQYENKRVLLETHLAALFSIRKVNIESAAEIKQLVRDTTDAVDALECLGSPTNTWDHILVYMTVQKLDSATLKDWEDEISENHEPSTFKELISFLKRRIRTLEAIDRISKPRKASQNASAIPKSNPSAKAHHTSAELSNETENQDITTKAQSSCSLCSASHYISSCPDYRAKPPSQRREILTQKNLCFNCLGPHQIRNCRSVKRCHLCGHPHHTSIHRSNEATERAAASSSHRRAPSTTIAPILSTTSSTSPSSKVTSDSQNNNEATSALVSQSSTINHTPVLLATAIVKVISSCGEKIEARALLDQGSEVSFITENLAQRLKLPRRKISLPINGIGGQRSTVTHGCLTLDIHSRTNETFSCSITAYVLAKLTSYLPPCRISKTNWSHIAGLPLADPDFVNSKPIDLILGAEIYSRVLEAGIRKGSANSPIAQQTAFGWILSGSTASFTSNQENDRAVLGLQCSIDHHLHELLQRFWLQEEPATYSSTALNEDESQCEASFVSSHFRDPEGRYTVHLPIKRHLEDYGDSFGPSVRMLARQEKRFADDPSLKSAYTSFLAEYETLGHMTRVSEAQRQTRRVFYLPHHAVVRESSSTTKVRVVFNGSFRTNFGLTLNESLHVGPKLQTNLFDVITRWRRYLYVFSADIEKIENIM